MMHPVKRYLNYWHYAGLAGLRKLRIDPVTLSSEPMFHRHVDSHPASRDV